ncbi:MAG: rhomboid family intramembrane serine protease [Fluviicola sp.]|nr:rhomboid family intramembrane serine protease [Fluviicola sp.]
MSRNNQFGSAFEAILYPSLLVLTMWLVFWADHLFPEIDFYKFGIKPYEISSLKGILLMPLIHAKNEIGHIVNNSPPTFILLAAIIFYYKEIAFKVFALSWLLTGIGVWVFAANNNSFHIGMSGVVYAMAAFLFTSGVIRKYKPLQAISLFVAFIYGGMIWGVFPIKEQVSWEGHLAGMLVGVILALIYRKKGPQAPKFLYEIEKELGIEPPDLEGEYNEKVRIETERLAEIERVRRAEQEFRARNEEHRARVQSVGQEKGIRIVYDYKEKPKGSEKKEE